MEYSEIDQVLPGVYSFQKYQNERTQGKHIGTLLHEVRKLYRQSNDRFKEADAKRESDAEYWRGRVDVLYAVLSLIQEQDRHKGEK